LGRKPISGSCGGMSSLSVLKSLAILWWAIKVSAEKETKESAVEKVSDLTTFYDGI